MRKKHKKRIIWGVVIIAVLVGLFALGGSSADTWADTDVSCLPGGHQNAVTHIHAHLSVVVDGEEQIIPANTGINNSCMAEVHTHDRSGEIHIETPDSSAALSIADFFAVWDEPLERDGFERTILVDDTEETPEYEFEDGDEIEVQFVSSTTTPETAGTGTPATSTTDTQ